jgi:hypothetical protein
MVTHPLSEPVSSFAKGRKNLLPPPLLACAQAGKVPTTARLSQATVEQSPGARLLGPRWLFTKEGKVPVLRRWSGNEGAKVEPSVTPCPGR